MPKKIKTVRKHTHNNCFSSHTKPTSTIVVPRIVCIKTNTRKGDACMQTTNKHEFNAKIHINDAPLINAQDTPKFRVNDTPIIIHAYGTPKIYFSHRTKNYQRERYANNQRSRYSKYPRQRYAINQRSKHAKKPRQRYAKNERLEGTPKIYVSHTANTINVNDTLKDTARSKLTLSSQTQPG